MGVKDYYMGAPIGPLESKAKRGHGYKAIRPTAIWTIIIFAM